MPEIVLKKVLPTATIHDGLLFWIRKKNAGFLKKQIAFIIKLVGLSAGIAPLPVFLGVLPWPWPFTGTLHFWE